MFVAVTAVALAMVIGLLPIKVINCVFALELPAPNVPRRKSKEAVPMSISLKNSGFD